MVRASVKELRDALVDALVAYDTKVHFSEYCEKRYEESPEDDFAELMFYRSFKEERDAFDNVKEILRRMVGCDGATANTMLRKYRTEIDTVIECWVRDRKGDYADLREIIR